MRACFLLDELHIDFQKSAVEIAGPLLRYILTPARESQTVNNSGTWPLHTTFSSKGLTGFNHNLREAMTLFRLTFMHLGLCMHACSS